MLSQMLNALQLILIPLALVIAVVGGCAIYFLGRPPRDGRAGHRSAAPARSAPSARATVAAHQDNPPFSISGYDTAPASFDPPAAASRLKPAPAPWPPLAADLLLVDDSAVARAKLRRLFEPAGYRVALARDGVEALALLGQGRYALMITDLEMPNLDGVELISNCLGNPATADMPILAITGHDDLHAKLNECHDICGIYRKPWIDDDLLSHVEGLVARPAGYRAGTATA